MQSLRYTPYVNVWWALLVHCTYEACQRLLCRLHLLIHRVRLGIDVCRSICFPVPSFDRMLRVIRVMGESGRRGACLPTKNRALELLCEQHTVEQRLVRSSATTSDLSETSLDTKWW